MTDATFLAALMQDYNQPFSGWDFDYLADRRVEEPCPWDYAALARDALTHATAAVDLATGGGERLLALRDVFPARMAATEGYRPNYDLARERLSPYGVTVVEANDSLSAPLPFEDAAFDLVLDRHGAFNGAEVARVLRSAGTLLTQQVDGRPTDLHAAFNAPAAWPSYTLEFQVGLLRDVPLVVEEAREWTGEVRFTDVGALVYYLKAVPWIVPGFSVSTHLSYLERLRRRLESDGVLLFHQTLMLIRARKQ